MSMDTRISIENHHWCLWFEKILKCNYNILTKKVFLYFYCNVFLSFYLNIVCKNIVCELGLNTYKCSKKDHSMHLRGKMYKLTTIKANYLTKNHLQLETRPFLGHFLVRPCVRQNFPNFSFSRVSEMFGCRSSECGALLFGS